MAPSCTRVPPLWVFVCARLSVPTRFLKSWIEAHYVDRVLSAYRSESPGVERINIGVRGTPIRDPARLPKANGEGARLAGTVSLLLGGTR